MAQERANNGRPRSTRFCIVDAQSVKNTDTARHKGYDAGKKVSGIKRHLAVDTQGLPHAIAVTTADVNDRDGALLMLLHNEDSLSAVQKVLVDGGYTGERFGGRVWQILGAGVEVAKRRAAQIRCHSEALGGGALLCLAGEMPAAMEELRTQAAYQSAIDRAGLPGAPVEKTLNRL